MCILFLNYKKVKIEKKNDFVEKKVTFIKNDMPILYEAQ